MIRNIIIQRLFPDFLLSDRNGGAMIAAIERALQIMCSTVQSGIENLQNIDKMPEWRLDEMAWELGCLYDRSATLEQKRHWIKNATPLFASLGTPQAIYNFLEGYFSQVELEENWQYAGEPYHFRVTVSGEWTPENEAWLRRAVEASKNIRSILDNVAVGSGTTIIVRGEGGVLTRFSNSFASPDSLCGSAPEVNTIGRITDGALVIATRDTRGYTFPYTGASPDESCGTEPQEATIGRIAEAALGVSAQEARGYAFPYPLNGTEPQENTIGTASEASATTQSDGKATAFSYSPCAEDSRCGGGDI